MAGTLNIVIIGAGFGGICAGIKLLERGETDFAILEKSHEVGGTWRENTYPGAACDVPAPLYCYSFHPNPDWSRLYPPQREIKAYIENAAETFGVMPYIRFGQRASIVRFDEAKALWGIEMFDGNIVHARHVIMGHGGLHHPLVPEFEGLQNFTGPTFHTARWDHSEDLAGKRVAVIGSAASAIQLIPELAETVSELHVFQRTPNYVAPRNDRVLSSKEQTQEGQLALRQTIFDELQANAEPLIPADSELGKQRGQQIMAYMRHVIDDPVLAEKLTPDYALGCKRILISDNFYQSLNLNNVSLNTDGVSKFEANALVSGADERIEIDAVVFATGFDLTSHSMSIQYIGLGEQNLLMRWMKGADSWRGAQVPGFPNLYWISGPNTGVATTSVVVMIEAQLDYILQLIKLAGDDNLISPKETRVKAEDDALQAALAETVWAKGGCNSWYLGTGDSARISTLYPYGVERFRKDRDVALPADFDIVPKT